MLFDIDRVIFLAQNSHLMRHGGLPAKGKEVFVYTSGLEIECTQMIDFFQFVVKSHSKLVSVNFLKQC